MDLKVYHCEICGNILTPLYDAKVVPFCCGQKMAILTANTQDAAYEKHVPAVEVNGNQVSIQIGSVLHPSVERQKDITYATLNLDKNQLLLLH